MVTKKKWGEKKNICVFKFILNFHVSADLEWWICTLVFFVHLPD